MPMVLAQSGSASVEGYSSVGDNQDTTRLNDQPGFAVRFQRRFFPPTSCGGPVSPPHTRSGLLLVFCVSSARLGRRRYRLYMRFLAVTASGWPTPPSCPGGDDVLAAGDAADAIVGSSDSLFLFSPNKAPNDTSVPMTSALMAATRGPFLADLIYAILSCKYRTQPIATCDSDSGGLEAVAVLVG
jgi:hypothetical protein